jgi:cytochrome c
MASSLEGNKIFAAILTAAIVASASGVVSRIVYAPHELEENVYEVDLAAIGVEEEEPEEAAPIAARLASADPAAGEAGTKACTSCHGFEQGAANKVGPPLWGIVQTDIASHDFEYSSAMAELEGAWTYENLDAFLASPRNWLPGTKMSFAGINDPEKRADVIAYLRSLSDSPAPLPEAPAGAEGEPAGGGEPSPAQEAPANEAPAGDNSGQSG